MSRWRTTAFLIVSCGLLAGGLGCRTLRPQPAVDLPEMPLQALFRVDYSGPRSGGTGKLTLRLWEEGDFLLDLRDPLGRRRWSLRAAADTAWLLEAGADRYCRLTPDAVLAVTGWADLPVGRLPQVLLGDAPIAGLRVGADSATTPEGRWSFEWHRGRLDQWGLWRPSQPVVWWYRQEEGGVLIGAGGEQLRWRERVREPMDAPASSLLPPAGAEETSCERLALP